MIINTDNNTIKGCKALSIVGVRKQKLKSCVMTRGEDVGVSEQISKVLFDFSFKLDHQVLSPHNILTIANDSNYFLFLSCFLICLKIIISVRDLNRCLTKSVFFPDVIAANVAITDKICCWGEIYKNSTSDEYWPSNSYYFCMIIYGWKV